MSNNINDIQTKTPFNNIGTTNSITNQNYYYPSITRRDVLTKLKDLYQYEDIESIRKGILDLMVEIGSSNMLLSDINISYRKDGTIDNFPSVPYSNSKNSFN